MNEGPINEECGFAPASSTAPGVSPIDAAIDSICKKMAQLQRDLDLLRAERERQFEQENVRAVMRRELSRVG